MKKNRTVKRTKKDAKQFAGDHPIRTFCFVDRCCSVNLQVKLSCANCVHVDSFEILPIDKPIVNKKNAKKVAFLSIIELNSIGYLQ